MLPKSNIHTHTTFGDGRDTPEAMVEAALKLGFHTLGFSEHGYADYCDYGMTPSTEPAYRETVLRLRERYAGQIDILLGYEHDWLAPPADYPYDYVIESVHYLERDGAIFDVDYTRPLLEEAVRVHYGGDIYALCRHYFRSVCESCESGADIIGHMELVMKFNEARDLFDDGDPRYLNCALEAADCAADSGKLIEVNTGAVAKGYRTQPYPGPAMLKRLAERNAPIILTTDCHDARKLDCNFRLAAELAKACGFKTALERRGGEFVPYLL